MTTPADTLVAPDETPATPIQLIQKADLAAWRAAHSGAVQTWLDRQGFDAKPGQVAWVEIDGNATVLVGWTGTPGLASLGDLPFALPAGRYRYHAATLQTVLGWALGAYRFDRYQAQDRGPASLVVDDPALREKAQDICDAVCLTRDLVNTPAADMGPSHLCAEVGALAERFDADFSVYTGDELLDLNCGAIHAVGRAAEDPPRLMNLSWGNPQHPQIVLIGKGVTFDSGGLDIKPASGMRLMKKDMGGAATAIGLAQLVMARALPVHLRLLIPAAENAIAGNAFRPGDILATRKGLTVEIDNTDAEGRLLLCDALAMAAEENPALVIDFATLTGSARSALGTEVAAMFCNDDKLADALQSTSTACEDAVWRMPLHQDYRHMLDSKIADLVNSAASPYAGSITAALFLERFIGDHPWAHFDLMAYNVRPRPGRPEGGEAMALRAVFTYLEQVYGAA